MYAVGVRRASGFVLVTKGLYIGVRGLKYRHTCTVRLERSRKAIQNCEAEFTKVHFECSGLGRKEADALAPQDLGYEHFFAFPANRSILPDGERDMAAIVANLVERIGKAPRTWTVRRSSRLDQERLVLPLLI